MKYFAKLGAGNEVVGLDVLHEGAAATEEKGIAFLKKLHGEGDVWKQCSKDGSVRKNAAGIGMTYDEARDAFTHPQPFPSFIFNEDTCIWEAPVARPDDGKSYTWNEPTRSWEELIE